MYSTGNLCTVQYSVEQFSTSASGSEVDLFVVGPAPALHCNQVMTGMNCREWYYRVGTVCTVPERL